MQMQRQTFPVDHAIFVNSSDAPASKDAKLCYDKILADAHRMGTSRVSITYGKSKTQHENHIAALKSADIERYELFLKIDDDDIYMANYVEKVVRDYLSRRWDFSGSFSDGVLKGHRWYPDNKLQHLGLDQNDVALGIPGFMPPTAAFSRKAIKRILDMPANGGFEDIQWRQALAKDPSMTLATRKRSNFIYNIHGENISTGSWLQK